MSEAKSRGFVIAGAGMRRSLDDAPAALAAAIDSYLPIVRVLVLLGNAMPSLRERLLQRVEAALRPEA